MFDVQRRWKSIDRKLPLLASGLVVLTSLVLAITAYVLLERALIDAAGRRLFSSAQVVAQMVTRPSSRVSDTTVLKAHRTLRAFARGVGSRDSGMRALELIARAQARDSGRAYAALLDTAGRVTLETHLGGVAAPRWAATAIASGDIRGDTLHVGPLERGTGAPTVATVRPLVDSSGAPRRVGYLVESRPSSGRGARQIRQIIGGDAQVMVGQPGAGVWSDFEGKATAPPVLVRVDSTVVFAEGVGASARVPGLNWMVWVSTPRARVVAPARTLLWSMIPIGLAIALIGAAITWRVTQRITHPIVELTAAAENIAKDSGGPRLEKTVLMPIDADEISRLRYAFERMAMRVAERQTLELQLRHAQKMEAVGRLAGGVAHDFNNLLTAIRSYADLLLDDMPDWDPKRTDALEIRAATQRAATLTAQLLAFSRKQMLQPRVLETHILLHEMHSMLRRLMEVDIELRVRTPEELWPVKADRGQLEQVIVNLAVNARDAMPYGGALTITGLNAEVKEPIETRQGTVPPGDYVVISVTDSGFGMDATTLGRVFEPFFTTKPIGHGTGLGLATVHGIVAQSGGYITVHSAPQKGATFAVYLPRVHEKPERDSGHKLGEDSVILSGRNETILLVEDEPAVRSLAVRVLSRAGDRVLEAATPTEALRLATESAGLIKLVLSDVVMPEMTGPNLVAKVTELCPQTRVLYISGYTGDDIISRGLADPGLKLLQKPFSAQELVERVKQALQPRAEPTTSRAVS
jgi:signal transduction histidine kinase/ActR/RegA family two-component response regulator